MPSKKFLKSNMATFLTKVINLDLKTKEDYETLKKCTKKQISKNYRNAELIRLDSKEVLGGPLESFPSGLRESNDDSFFYGRTKLGRQFCISLAEGRSLNSIYSIFISLLD